MSECNDATASADGPRPGSSFGLDVTKLASGAVVAQVIGFVFTPILTRLFPPEAYGLQAVFVSLASILGTVACLRYELAIMLPESDEEAANLFTSSVFFVVLLSGATVPLVLFGGDMLVRVIRIPGLLPYFWLIPVMVFLNGVLLALNYWNTRKRHYGRLSANRVLNALSSQTVNLGLGAAGHATGGSMIGAAMGGQALAVAALGWQTGRDSGSLFRQAVRWKRMWAGIKRYRKFPLIDIWGALLNSVSWQLPPLMLAALFSQAVTGYYALSFRLLQMPMSFIGASLGQVFFQRASEVRADAAKLAETTEMVFKRLVSLCLFPALLITVAGREFFVLVFGPQWAVAGVYAQILSPWAFCWFISSPLSTIFSVRERQGLAFVMQLAIFVTRVLSLCAGGLMSNVYLALGLFSASGVLVYGVLIVWNLSLAGVSGKVGYRHVFQHLACALPGAALLLALKAVGFDPLATTCVAGAELALYYAVLLRMEPGLCKHLRRPAVSPCR